MPKSLARTPDEIDAALSLCQGNLRAAGKLLDLAPRQVANVVSYQPTLKAKWGRKQRGRPKGTLGFTIVPWTPDEGSDRERLEVLRAEARKTVWTPPAAILELAKAEDRGRIPGKR